MAKKIKFAYFEDGEIDWENTVLPVVDMSPERWVEVPPTPRDNKLLQEINNTTSNRNR